MTTSFPDLIQEANVLFTKGPAGVKEADDALTDALNAAAEMKSGEADAEAYVKALTETHAETQRRLNAESLNAKAGRLNAVKTLREGGLLDDCAQSYAASGRVEALLTATLQSIVETEIPAALIAHRLAQWAAADARAYAVRCECIAHLLACIIAARPLMDINGGQVELIVTDANSKTGLLATAVHNTYQIADNLKAVYDSEVKQQAAIAAKSK